MARLHHHLKNAFIPHSGNDYRPHALRRPMLHTYTGILLAVKILTVLVVSVYASPARVSDITPATIIQLTNVQRIQRKIGSLATNPLLTKAALKKADDMAQKNYFAHISPSGITPWYWFKQAGYSYTYAGENLAIDFVTSEDIITAWLNSPSHRANLLSSKYRDIGVAVQTANIDGVPSIIVVQMFGAPIKPTTKTVTVPAQKPTTVQAKTLANATPPPSPIAKVLGEAAQEVVPIVPTIVTPESGSLVRTTQPSFIGKTNPGAIVTLFIQGVRVATATADVSGTYTVTPDKPLPQGATTAQVTSTIGGTTSSLSSAWLLTVDSEAPTIDISRSVVLPSYLDEHGYTVAVAVTGNPQTVRIGTYSQTSGVTTVGETYIGSVSVAPASIPGPILVQAQDTAGNQSATILADPSIFTTGVVASTGGALFEGVRLVFYSRAFLTIFLVLLTMLAVVNILVEIRHQHHPTIVHSLLVVFLAATLVLL